MSAQAYDIAQSYQWNYEHAPFETPRVEVPEIAGPWNFCGIPVNSPLGVPAGPLLNSRWILYYAALGFDVLTYKTVRSSFRESYELPNLLPVRADSLDREGMEVAAAGDSADVRTWAISFGMPSKDPAVWRADVECARKGMHAGQVLVVSVVASPQPGWSIEQVAVDFARCALWATESGAQAIEANLSCPNVCTQEGDLYLSPAASRAVATAIRSEIAGLPLILKIGLFPRREQAQALVESVDGIADALSTTNSITATVKGSAGEPLFGGLKRGVGGAAISSRCLAEAQMLTQIIADRGSRLRLISVGGVASANDVRSRLDAGAHHVQIATAAMLDPLVAIRIREQLAHEER